MVAPFFRRPSGATASPLEALKRRFYLWMLGLLVLSGALSTLLFTEGYFFDRVFTPLLLLALAGFACRLWRRPASLPMVERGVTLAAGLGYTIILTHTLYLSPEEGVRETFLGVFRLWGPLIYLWAYLALGSRRGLSASLAFYGATLALSLPYLLFYPPEDVAFGGRYLLGDFYLASLAYIAGLYAFATFLEQQVKERTKAEALAHHAYTDPLTGLPNRRLLMERLERTLQEHKALGVLFIDLDGFKGVNDSLGHHAGDALLGEVAMRLRGCVREGDTLARLGGDEFAVVLPGLRNKEDALLVARKVVEALGEPFELGGCTANVTASVGVSFYPQNALSATELLSQADEAMYRAKAGGKNGYREGAGLEEANARL